MNQGKIVGIQYAALPFRIVAGQVWILLITSRGTQRWVIPKGWPMTGLKPQEAAAIEAAEEAGIVGDVQETPIGSYRYDKRLKGEITTAVQVIVFPFKVQARPRTGRSSTSVASSGFAARRPRRWWPSRPCVTSSAASGLTAPLACWPRACAATAPGVATRATD
jgi:hypothetical protein